MRERWRSLDRGWRIAIATVAALLLVLLVTQIAIPPLAEKRIENRLEEHGGKASVTLTGLPAVRLLTGDGHRIAVRGSGQRFELEDREEGKVLERLDGFDRVDVRLRDFRAGPLRVSDFKLVRRGSGPYRLDLVATGTPRDLAAEAGSQLGGPLGETLGEAATGFLPDPDLHIPFDLEVRLKSEDGRPRVVSGAGSVAGIPLGPLAEFVANAVVSRL